MVFLRFSCLFQNERNSELAFPSSRPISDYKIREKCFQKGCFYFICIFFSPGHFNVRRNMLEEHSLNLKVFAV